MNEQSYFQVSPQMFAPCGSLNPGNRLQACKLDRIHDVRNFTLHSHTSGKYRTGVTVQPPVKYPENVIK